MSLNFKVPNGTLETVRTKLNEVLATPGAIPDFAKVTWDNNDLLVRIDKAGKSEFRIAVKPEGGDVRIQEAKRDVAFLHKPFVARVETFVADVLSKIGANKA